jgi:branched-chain amino acid transport system permease protein/neutral amino acid transport system permease protein
MQRIVTSYGPRPAERFRAFMGTRLAGALMLLLFLALTFLFARTTGVTGERLLALVVRGVMLGGIIALGAIGLSLVFGVLRIPNFAQGDLMTAGAFIALVGVSLIPNGPPLAPFSFGYELIISLLLAMIAVGAVAYGLDRVIYRRLRARNSPPVILAMASLGAAFLVRSIIYLVWGADFSFYYTGRPRAAVELFAGIRVLPDQLFILGLALLLIILVYLLLEHTKIGKAMRATADNADLARISGINTDRVVMWTWFIGGGLAGASGVMYGLYSQLRPEMGWFLLLPLFASVILGTIGNPYGALAGALIIGISWQVSTAFVNSTYGPGVAFLVMILVLIVRPQGLFGKPGG